MTQQALASPIEYIDLSAGVHSFTFDLNGAGALNGDCYPGTYADILTFIYNMDIRLGVYNADMYCYLNSDYKVVIRTASTNQLDIVWKDPILMRLLGFRDDLAGTYTYTATDTPGKMWIPPYYSADLNHPDDDTQISGGNAVDGTFSGISLAPGRYTRHHKWNAVTAVDTYKSACVVSYAYGGTTYYPEEERCLDQFTINALSASPTGTEGISIKGAYYIEDLDDYVGAVGAASKCPAAMDGGGHRLRLTTTPDNYIFCGLKPSRWDRPEPSIPNHNSHYNVGVELVSAVGGVPTWSRP